ncbi:MAG TPA: NTP transferase domain-containing protein [Solirubrobacterales bacterium]|nr:NTP transferase domain-containing protein [Solirubrobacterales bacterium]
MRRSPKGTGAIGPAVGAVLAGGGGRRIGGTKAAVELAGRPLIFYPLAAVEAAGLEAIVVAKRDSALPSLGCPLIEEPERPRHPLCGIVAALRYAGGRPLIAIGCDMPFVPPALLSWLASVPQPLAVPTLEGHPQPFPARYSRGLLPALEQGLANLQSMRRTIESLGPLLLEEEELAAFGDPGRLCFNVNTLEDLRKAEELLGATRGEPPRTV